MMRINHCLPAVILSVALLGCRPQPKLVIPAPSERPEAGRVIENPQPPLVPFTLSNPRSIQAQIVLIFKNVEQLDGEFLHESNRSRGIPDDLPPSLLLWSPDPVEDLQQKNTGSSSNIPPDSVFNDYPNGNRFLQWDLTSYLQTSNTLEMRRTVHCVNFDLKFQINPSLIGPYETDGGLFRVYTRPEDLLEPTDGLRALVNSLTSKIANPYDKAGEFYDWVTNEVDDVVIRAASRIEESPAPQISSDEHYTLKFVNLCRIAGIPSRSVCGFQIHESSGTFRTWAEFYLPNYGWVPADPYLDGADRRGRLGRIYFGELPNDRMVLARGINLPMKPSLSWATYSNSDLHQDHILTPKPFLIAVSGLRAATEFHFLVVADSPLQL